MAGVAPLGVSRENMVVSRANPLRCLGVSVLVKFSTSWRCSALSTYGPPRPQVIWQAALTSLRQRIRPRKRAPGEDGHLRGPSPYITKPASCRPSDKPGFQAAGPLSGHLASTTRKHQRNQRVPRDQLCGLRCYRRPGRRKALLRDEAPPKRRARACWRAAEPQRMSMHSCHQTLQPTAERALRLRPGWGGRHQRRWIRSLRGSIASLRDADKPLACLP